VTPRDAAEREGRPPERAVAPERLPGVLGAARSEAAARSVQRPDEQLVGADQGDESDGHGPPRLTTGW